MTTTDANGPERFKLIWREGAYYVSEPNIDSCEVVRADLYDQQVFAFNEQQKALSALKQELQDTKEALYTEALERDELKKELEGCKKQISYDSATIERIANRAIHMEVTRDRYRDLLALVLPMAKAYAHMVPVGSNVAYCREADEALNPQEHGGGG